MDLKRNGPVVLPGSAEHVMPDFPDQDATASMIADLSDSMTNAGDGTMLLFEVRRRSRSLTFPL